MQDIHRHWTSNGVRNHLTVRYWIRGVPLRTAWNWLRGDRWAAFDPEFRLRTEPGDNGRCYCPTGSTTSLRVGAFGWGLWVWLSRDRTPKPCPCDKIHWLLFASDYADEIEEYGEAKLKAEFPHIEPLCPKVASHA